MEFRCREETWPPRPVRFSSMGRFWGKGKREKWFSGRGPKPGDDSYVTGTLGDSLLGLKIGQEKGKKRISPEEEYLLDRHFNPTPRAREGRILGERRLVHSRIDVSDGLLSNLGQICEESRVGARLWVERLPLSPSLRAVAATRKSVDWQLALQGGRTTNFFFPSLRKMDPGFRPWGGSGNAGLPASAGSNLGRAES